MRQGKASKISPKQAARLCTLTAASINECNGFPPSNLLLIYLLIYACYICHKVFLHCGGVGVLEYTTSHNIFLVGPFLICEVLIHIYIICCDNVHLVSPKILFLNRFTLTCSVLQSNL